MNNSNKYSKVVTLYYTKTKKPLIPTYINIKFDTFQRFLLINNTYKLYLYPD